SPRGRDGARGAALACRGRRRPAAREARRRDRERPSEKARRGSTVAREARGGRGGGASPPPRGARERLGGRASDGRHATPRVDATSGRGRGSRRGAAWADSRDAVSGVRGGGAVFTQLLPAGFV